MADAREGMLNANRNLLSTPKPRARVRHALLEGWTLAVAKGELERVRALDAAWRSLETAVPEDGLDGCAITGRASLYRADCGALCDFRTCASCCQFRMSTGRARPLGRQVWHARTRALAP